MVIAHGDVVWVDFGSPRGFRARKTSTGGCHARRQRPRPLDASGLDRDSVAIVSQLGPVSREHLEPFPVGRVPSFILAKVAAGIRLVTGI